MKSQGTTRWWNGLPLAGQRDLTDEELLLVSQLARKTSIRRMRWLFLPAIALVVFIPVSSAFPDSPLASLYATLWVFLLVFCVLWARDNDRKTRALRLDIEAGTVDIFRPDPDISPDMYSQVRGALSPDQLLSLRSVEVLNQSGCIWRVNDIAADQDLWRKVAESALRAEVAATPDIAEMAAQWVEPFETEDAPGLHRNFRQLSDSEKSEILRLGRKMLWRSIPLAVVFTVWVSIPLALWMSGSKPEPGIWPLIRLACIGFVAVLRDWLAVQDLLMVSRMREDVRRGEVVVLRVEQEGEGNNAEGAILSPPEERLPVSWLPWTYDGRPVQWRLANS